MLEFAGCGQLCRDPSGPTCRGSAVGAVVAILPAGKFAFRAIDHHWDRPQFATAGAAVEIWDHERSEPVHSFSWGADTITSGGQAWPLPCACTCGLHWAV